MYSNTHLMVGIKSSVMTATARSLLWTDALARRWVGEQRIPSSPEYTQTSVRRPPQRMGAHPNDLRLALADEPSP